MLRIQAALRELTGSLEMSLFQTLLAGNIGQSAAPGTLVPAGGGGGAEGLAELAGLLGAAVGLLLTASALAPACEPPACGVAAAGAGPVCAAGLTAVPQAASKASGRTSGMAIAARGTMRWLRLVFIADILARTSQE
jgi:hypothetical protein